MLPSVLLDEKWERGENDRNISKFSELREPKLSSSCGQIRSGKGGNKCSLPQCH